MSLKVINPIWFDSRMTFLQYLFHYFHILFLNCIFHLPIKQNCDEMHFVSYKYLACSINENHFVNSYKIKNCTTCSFPNCPLQTDYEVALRGYECHAHAGICVGRRVWRHNTVIVSLKYLNNSTFMQCQSHVYILYTLFSGSLYFFLMFQSYRELSNSHIVTCFQDFSLSIIDRMISQTVYEMKKTYNIDIKACIR